MRHAFVYNLQQSNTATWKAIKILIQLKYYISYFSPSYTKLAIDISRTSGMGHVKIFINSLLLDCHPATNMFENETYYINHISCWVIMIGFGRTGVTYNKAAHIQIFTSEKSNNVIAERQIEEHCKRQIKVDNKITIH